MTSCSSQRWPQCDKWALIDLHCSQINPAHTSGERACASAGETVVGPSFMNGKGHLSFFLHIWSQGLCRGELLFMQPRIKCLSRGHSSAPSVPNLLPIYNNYSRVCCLLLQISAHRCRIGVTASRAAWRRGWTQNRILIVFQPNRTRRWAGCDNTGLKGLVAITWGFRREAARHSQLCAWAGPPSYHHPQEAMKLQGPSAG